MVSELEAAVHAARLAGDVLRENFGKKHRLVYKGEIDIVTEMDTCSEQTVINILQNAFPAYGFLSEESSTPSENTIQWIIDPLDGTTNYAHGFPYFAVSIALACHEVLEIGVVYNPLADELFTAQRGAVACLNGKPIRVSATDKLGKSLLASGFPYDAWDGKTDNTAEWGRFVRRVVSMRSNGAAALDLCQVAAGRLDGFWELNLGAWDMAAGALIVQEAGGVTTTTSGDRFHLKQNTLAASNGLIHHEILAVLNMEPNQR